MYVRTYLCTVTWLRTRVHTQRRGRHRLAQSLSTDSSPRMHCFDFCSLASSFLTRTVTAGSREVVRRRCVSSSAFCLLFVYRGFLWWAGALGKSSPAWTPWSWVVLKDGMQAQLPCRASSICSALKERWTQVHSELMLRRARRYSGWPGVWGGLLRGFLNGLPPKRSPWIGHLPSLRLPRLYFLKH
jgi:hypothetical protein